ncbi:MAG: sensor histidine kinase [Terriglobia bacterium]
MTLELVSNDQAFLTIVREIAAEFPAANWKLEHRREASGNSDSDICLWDYHPDIYVPESMRWGARCFVLVDSRDLDDFRSTHRYAEPGIVLKPVTRAVVRALLVEAMSSAAKSSEAALRNDRDEILQSLMQANLRLQQYDAERTNFLGRGLHDFHAPLTALSGYCGLLLEENMGPLDEAQKLIVNRMQNSVRRLSRMSRALFQLSIGRHVVLKPALRAADIRECAEQALYEIQPLLQEKNLQLDVDFEAPPTPLLFDPAQMEQVLINLLENACKFSSRAGSVVIRGYRCFTERRAANVSCPVASDRRMLNLRVENAYRVDIADSGPGVSPEHVASIFEEYVSYSGGNDRSRGGLGLAICRMILNQHQGRIWAENSESGAVFSFVLPLRLGDGDYASPEASRPPVAAESFAACV